MSAAGDDSIAPVLLITGSAGLVGRHLARRFAAVRGYDLRHGEDVLDERALEAAMAAADGVVHLAAVSRVIWGEREPDRCVRVNRDGTAAVLRAALRAPRRPWVLFASSREVYGEPDRLPVGEDAPLAPINVYGRTKVDGERLTLEARSAGLTTAVVRLSNVYGCADDHADRVVPAFARAAATGGTLRLDGAENTFDFTHIDDVVAGLALLAARLGAGEADLPPVHLVSGTATTLAQLAALAVELGGDRARVVEAPARRYDVARFVGDPTRARALLGWAPRVDLRAGLARLVGQWHPRAGG